MFDDVPVRIWLLIGLGAAAFAPARDVYRHVMQARSLNDEPGWRDAIPIRRSVSILAGLVAIALFIFTPMAERFANSASFWPLLISGFGLWALSTVWRGFFSGKIQPAVRGMDATYERDTQPWRFWASMAWNACAGFFCLIIAVGAFEQDAMQAQDRCLSGHEDYPCARNTADPDAVRIGGTTNPIAARGADYHRAGDYPHAITDYVEAIRQNPNDADSIYNLALVYQQTNDPRSAIGEYSDAISLRPDFADAYYRRGQAYSSIGDRLNAELDFMKAAELRGR